MKRFVRYLLYILVTLIIIVVVFVGWIMATKPNVGPAEHMNIERTPERIARGEYLANHVMLCMDCHAIRDFRYFAGPISPGTEGSGGQVFDQSMGFPGRFISRNITPAGIGDWTDGEIYRAITTGVTRDGHAIFPVMPYANYALLDPEDIKSVIAYIRTLQPNNVEIEKSKSDFPFNIIMRTIPQKAEPMPRPDPSETVAYGKYMVTAGACRECHTKFEGGKFVGPPLAGGRSFVFPDGGILTSPNLTPHLTGLGEWTKEKFISTFKQYSDSSYLTQPLQPGHMQTLMPWIMYAGMHESDLGAIYDYLQSLDPVENEVVKFVPPKSK